MLSGQAPAGGQGMPGGFGGMPGMGGPGAPGAAGADPFASLLGGGFGKQAQQKKSTDAFITDRIPVLAKIRRPVLVGFFAYSLHKGWVGRWGFMQGAFMGSSYLDMLAVPLRNHPSSWFYQWAYFQAQIYVDLGARLLGFLINVARGKTKIPSISDMKQKIEDMKNMQPPGGGMPGAGSPFGAGASPFGAAGGASPFGAAGGASPFGAAGGASPWDFTDVATPPMAQPGSMPTAPTTPLQARPLQTSPLPFEPEPEPERAAPAQAAKPVNSRAPSRTPPPIIDADVTFLD